MRLGIDQPGGRENRAGRCGRFEGFRRDSLQHAFQRVRQASDPREPDSHSLHPSLPQRPAPFSIRGRTRSEAPSPALLNDDFKRAVETIKLRVPLEEIVRERVPGLKKAGALWVACCPFHEERTPSFKVDPRRQSWNCYGACATGGDVISFLQELDGLGFMEVLEILAARTGVELPRSNSGRSASEEVGDELMAALARAEESYCEALRGREGRIARDYLNERGFHPNTVEAFGVGYAPAAGAGMNQLARSSGLAPEAFERAGLLRTYDSGRRVDFFRQRLTIPIRDLAGRTVGFGARRLVDESDEEQGGRGLGPKYVNTPETPAFHKGRLVFALDRALEHVRREGHLVLVEGYTDVMAAHQVGLGNVAAVLGTSTTEGHAALIRRAGARRISLVFDGDEAGRRAAHRALAGLLPLDVELAVVSLPTGTDPCDLLLRDGSRAFMAHVEHASSWFDFLVEGLLPLGGAELAREVDRVFELLLCLRRPVHRESMVMELAGRLNLPVARVREQWEQLPERRRARARERERSRTSSADGKAISINGAGNSGQVVPRTPEQEAELRRHVRLWEGLVGAVLLDASLLPLLRPHVDDCPDDELTQIVDCILALYEDVDADIDEAGVLARMDESGARSRVVPCVTFARTAESPQALLDGALLRLRERELRSKKRRAASRVAELERDMEAGNPDAESALREAISELNELHRRGVQAQNT